MRPVGLVPVAENGVIRFEDADTGEIVFTTSPFYIYDSAATPNSYIDTDFTLESQANGIYALTVTIDEDYLATEGLTYPVYVDPTLTRIISGSFEMVGVYSGEPDTTHSSETSCYVGYRDDTYGQGRILLRLTALQNSQIFRSLTEEQLTSVTLSLTAAVTSTKTAYMYVYQFAGAEDWTVADATWNNVSATSTGLYQGYFTPSAYNIDITKVAKTWLGLPSDTNNTENSNKNDPASLMAKGLIIRNGNTSSTDYVQAYYRISAPGFAPQVTITSEEWELLNQIDQDHNDITLTGKTVEKICAFAGVFEKDFTEVWAGNIQAGLRYIILGDLEEEAIRIWVDEDGKYTTL